MLCEPPILLSGSEINKENLPSYTGKNIFWIMVTRTDKVKKDNDVIVNIFFLEIKILIKFLKSISSLSVLNSLLTSIFLDSVKQLLQN